GAQFGRSVHRLLHRGEGDPAAVLDEGVTLPAIGFLEFGELRRSIGRRKEPVNADVGRQLRSRLFAGLFSLLGRGTAGHPATPREADDHGQHRGADAGPEPDRLGRLITTPFFSHGHCFLLSLFSGLSRFKRSRYETGYHSS